MAAIVSIAGMGTRGAAGLAADSTDAAGTILLTFDAMQWETQPAASGEVVLTFGTPPNKAIPLDGWATLDPHLGFTTTITWTCATAPQPGTMQRIAYSL
jgi:hypothetical protein